MSNDAVVHSWSSAVDLMQIDVSYDGAKFTVVITGSYGDVRITYDRGDTDFVLGFIRSALVQQADACLTQAYRAAANRLGAHEVTA